MIWMGGSASPPSPPERKTYKGGVQPAPPRKKGGGRAATPKKKGVSAARTLPEKKTHKELNKEIKKERKKQRKGAVSYPEIKAERKQ